MSGTTALVTGASSGIGLAIAPMLLVESFDVTISSPADVAEVVRMALRLGPTARVLEVLIEIT